MSNIKEREALAEEAKAAIASIGTVFGARKRAERAIDKLASLPEQAAQAEPDDYKAWYIEAMVASNEAGYVGLSAAETIRALAPSQAVRVQPLSDAWIHRHHISSTLDLYGVPYSTVYSCVRAIEHACAEAWGLHAPQEDNHG